MIVPKYTREIPQRFRLEAEKCTNCGYVAFPPRLICPECGQKSFQMITLKPEGKILTYTIIRVGSDVFSRETPYAIAIIETNDNVKLMAMVADTKVDDVKIGSKVKLVFRKIQDEGVSGLHCYGYKAIVI